MSRIRGVVAAILVGLAITAFAPSPAYACSCVGGDTADFLEWSDAVLVGTVRDRHGVSFFDRFQEIPPVSFTVEVERLYRGAVGPSVRIYTAPQGATCGVDVKQGQRYVLFASHQAILGEPSDELWTNSCGGTAPINEQLVAEVEAILGGGRPPGPAPHEPVGGQALAGRFALASGGALVALTGLLWLRLWRQ